MSKWAYIPNSSGEYLGETLLSQINLLYQDKIIYEKFVGITYRYTTGENTWPVVNYDLSINFVKLLDSSLPEVASLRSYGIYNGCNLTKSGNTLSLSAGIAFFPQGRKVISAQTINIPAPNTELLLYIYMNYAGTITVSKDLIIDNNQLRLGSVTMDGNTILQVFTRQNSFMPGAIREFSDFIYEAGPFLSGATPTFTNTTGILSRIDGFINNFYKTPIRVPKNSQIKITKVYKGDVLGKSYTSLTLADLKEVSTQNGGTALTTGQTITHAFCIDPATLETYLFISDNPTTSTVTTDQTIISQLSNATKGEFFTRFCVLFASITVPFSATTLNQTIFINLHRGITGARGISKGEYPSPIDYPEGGTLLSKNNTYVIEKNTLDRIEEVREESKGIKQIIQKTQNGIGKKEYGFISSAKLRFYASSMMAGSASQYDIWGITRKPDETLVFDGVKDIDTTIYNPSLTGIKMEGSTIKSIFGHLLKVSSKESKVPRAPYIYKAQLGGPYSYSGRTTRKRQNQMVIVQVLQNIQPTEFEDLFSSISSTKTYPYNDTAINDLKNQMKALKEKINNKIPKMETWSCSTIFSCSEVGGNQFLYLGPYNASSGKNIMPDNFGLQPADIIFLDTIDMTIKQLRHYIVMIAYCGVFKPKTTDPNNPYKTKPYITRGIHITYADIKYTGTPT